MEFTGIGEPVNSANSGEVGSAFWGSRFEVGPTGALPLLGTAMVEPRERSLGPRLGVSTVSTWVLLCH